MDSIFYLSYYGQDGLAPTSSSSGSADTSENIPASAAEPGTKNTGCEGGLAR